jgi:hypothetical protein
MLKLFDWIKTNEKERINSSKKTPTYHAKTCLFFGIR